MDRGEWVTVTGFTVVPSVTGVTKPPARTTRCRAERTPAHEPCWPRPVPALRARCPGPEPRGRRPGQPGAVRLAGLRGAPGRHAQRDRPAHADDHRDAHRAQPPQRRRALPADRPAAVGAPGPPGPPRP